MGVEVMSFGEKGKIRTPVFSTLEHPERVAGGKKLQLPEAPALKQVGNGCHGFRKQYGCSQMGHESLGWGGRDRSVRPQWRERRRLRGREAGSRRCTIGTA